MNMTGQRFFKPAIKFTGPAEEREFKLIVGPPAKIIAAHHDIFDRAVDVQNGDAFADPFLVHFLSGVRPDFEVVGPHEMLGDAVTKNGIDKLTKVGGGFVIALGLCLD